MDNNSLCLKCGGRVFIEHIVVTGDEGVCINCGARYPVETQKENPQPITRYSRCGIPQLKPGGRTINGRVKSLI